MLPLTSLGTIVKNDVPEMIGTVFNAPICNCQAHMQLLDCSSSIAGELCSSAFIRHEIMYQKWSIMLNFF